MEKIKIILREYLRKDVLKNNPNISKEELENVVNIMVNKRLNEFTNNKQKIYKKLFYDIDNKNYFITFKGIKQDLINKEEQLLAYILEVLLDMKENNSEFRGGIVK